MGMFSAFDISKYADLSGGATWFDRGMAWAVNAGISDGSNPGNNITREELVTMIWRYMGSPTAKGDLSKFVDAGEVSGYAQGAMAWAVESGLVSGYGNGRLGARDGATRAQVAQVLQNLITKLDLPR